MSVEPSLHHVGHVVASIADSLERWRADLGAVTVTEIFEDPVQRVRVVFLGLPPDDLDGHISQMRVRKASLFRGPQPAVAFNGRRIAWMVTHERLLIEFLERRGQEAKL